MWNADNVEYRLDSKEFAFSGDTLIWCLHSDEYFTVEVITPGQIWFYFDGVTPTNGSYIRLDTEMSVNGGSWERVGSRTMTFNAGDKIRMRGEEVTYEGIRFRDPTSGTAATFKVYGNIMSLLEGDNFLNSQGFYNVKYVFEAFFYRNNGLVDASGLVLPEQNLTGHCYASMFDLCSNLVHAPKLLPAKEIGIGCYYYMFARCPKLVDAPVILGESGGVGGFEAMFLDCTSLTTSPDIYMRSAGLGNFDQMFDGCTALTSITCRMLNYDSDKFTNWVRNVPANGHFYKAHLAQWDRGVNGIPVGWTVTNVT